MEGEAAHAFRPRVHIHRRRGVAAQQRALPEVAAARERRQLLRLGLAVDHLVVADDCAARSDNVPSPGLPNAALVQDPLAGLAVHEACSIACELPALRAEKWRQQGHLLQQLADVAEPPALAVEGRGEVASLYHVQDAVRAGFERRMHVQVVQDGQFPKALALGELRLRGSGVREVDFLDGYDACSATGSPKSVHQPPPP
mmetsp:Transcript_65029/g.193873  ORF Transcript_65029/g.193873 Transcript_65029/m.193873 type:complete len:200 (-) Transcript_65029:541-1140(-)